MRVSLFWVASKGKQETSPWAGLLRVWVLKGKQETSPMGATILRDPGLHFLDAGFVFPDGTKYPQAPHAQGPMLSRHRWRSRQHG